MAIIPTNERDAKRSHKSNEGKIQAECFLWFWNTYPQFRRLLFHIPNENDRSDSNMIQGAIRKSLGVVAGVSDLILLVSRGVYHGLCIEMKDAKGVQRAAQKEWQILVESQGYRYEVCRSLDSFKSIIEEYIALR